MSPKVATGVGASRHAAAGGNPRSFTLILGGGGARGFAHAGVLRTLERIGWIPSAIVGVSMAAVIGAAYALHTDWYSALFDFAEGGIPETGSRPARGKGEPTSKLKQMAAGAKTMWDLSREWGADIDEVESGRDALRTLLGGADLADGRVPLAVSSTDLLSGERVVIREGPAVDAVYASSALAGVLPPERRGSWLLADGAYTDVCPIDVARELGHERVVAANPGCRPRRWPSLATGAIRPTRPEGRR